MAKEWIQGGHQLKPLGHLFSPLGTARIGLLCSDNKYLLSPYYILIPTAFLPSGSFLLSRETNIYIDGQDTKGYVLY